MQNLAPDTTATAFSIWVVIASSVISGIVGVVVTIIYSHLYEKRRMKLDILRRFAATRYDAGGEEFAKTMNEIFIVFQDSPKVMQSLADYHRFAKPDDWRDSLLKLFKEMCRNAGVKVEFNDSFFFTPLIPKPKTLPSESPLSVSPAIENKPRELESIENQNKASQG